MGKTRLSKHQLPEDTVYTQDLSGSVDEHNQSATAHADIRESLATATILPSYNSTTHKITFTTLGGNTYEIDLPMEDAVDSVTYNSSTKIITVHKLDGTSSTIDLSELDDEYTGGSNLEATVTIDNNKVIKVAINAINASKITYDNSTSGLTATNTQDALDEINTKVEDNADDISDLETNKADKATTLAGYGITDAYTKTEVDAKVSSVYRYKGTVNKYSDLPSSGQVVGDVYNIETADKTHGIKAGDNVAWNGTGWDVLGGDVDLSDYYTKTDADTLLNAKADKSTTYTKTEVDSALNDKVDKISGKGLSTNDYSDAEKIKLAGIEEEANKYVLPEATNNALGGIKVGSNLDIDANGVLTAKVDNALSDSSTNSVQNKVVKEALDDKVDKVVGKQLSTEDYSTEEKTKLAGIETGAEVNVIETVKVNNRELTPDQNKAVNVLVPEYTIEEVSTTEGYSKTYQLKKDNTYVGTKINIPKDLVVESGSVETVVTPNVPYEGAEVGDKYIDLVLSNTNNQHIYIPVKDLVDVYTAGAGIDVSNSNVVSIKLKTGATNGLNTDSNGLSLATVTQSTAGAMSASDKTKLDSIAEGAEENIIESIKVNSVAQTVTNKEVDITVPTALSELTNDNNTVTDASYVHTDNNFTNTEKTKLSGIESGAEKNIIETVKVNGTALTPDQDRAVDITVVGDASNISYNNTTSGLGATNVQDAIDELSDEKVDKVSGKQLSTEDYTTAEKTKLSGIENNADVNIIESISVNGTAQTITNKNVDIDVPTKTSDLTNDSGFIDNTVNDLTNYYDKTAIDAKVASVYKYKGSVNTYADLPTTGQVIGDVYNVATKDTTHHIKEGDNVAWNGTQWDVLSGDIDLTDYYTKTEVDTELSNKTDKVTNATNGNLASLDANGNLTDSGKKAADFQPVIPETFTGDLDTLSARGFHQYIATYNSLSNAPTVSYTVNKCYIDVWSDGAGNVCQIIKLVGLTYDPAVKYCDIFRRSCYSTGSALSWGAWEKQNGKTDLITSPINNNLVAMDSNGNLKDSGKKVSDLLNVTNAQYKYHRQISVESPTSAPYYLIYERASAPSSYGTPITLKGIIGRFATTEKATLDIEVDFRSSSAITIRGVVSSDISDVVDIIPTWDSSTNTARVYIQLKQTWALADIYSNNPIPTDAGVASMSGTEGTSMYNQGVTVAYKKDIFKTQTFSNVGSAGGTNKYIELSNAYPSAVVQENIYLVTGRGGESALIILPTKTQNYAPEAPKLIYLSRGTANPIVSAAYDNNLKLYIEIGTYTVVTISQIGGIRADWSAQILNELPSEAIITTDIDDLAFKTNYTDLAQEFSTSIEYNVGDVVVYNNALYKCVQHHNKTTWNADNFTQIKVFDYAATLQDVYGKYPYKTRVAQFSNNGSNIVYYKIVDDVSPTYNGPIIVRCIGQEPNYTANIQEITTINDGNFQKHTFMRHTIAQDSSGNEALGVGAYLITTGDEIWVAVKPNGTAKIELIAGISIEIIGTTGTPSSSIEINGSTALDARYTASITANSNKPLTSGALSNIIPNNISSSNKLVGADQAQLRTLTNPITVDGTQETTVEGALSAINSSCSSLYSQLVTLNTPVSIPPKIYNNAPIVDISACKVTRCGRIVEVVFDHLVFNAPVSADTYIIKSLPPVKHASSHLVRYNDGVTDIVVEISIEPDQAFDYSVIKFVNGTSATNYMLNGSFTYIFEE